MEVIIHSINELEKVVKSLLKFSEGKKKFFLFGEIGAGKTTFVKAVCEHLGVREEAVSPTFSLVNEYTYLESNSKKEMLVHHIDLYRLKDTEEAMGIGIEDYLYDDNYCFVEWAEIIEPLVPEGVVRIYVEIFENSGRKFKFI